jgi:hypothetical protein
MSPRDPAAAPSSPPRRGWLARLAPELREGFAAEAAETNARRLRALLPLMVVLHAVHMALFRVGAAARASLSPNLLAWHDDLVLAHAGTLAFALAPAILLYRPRALERPSPLLGPVVALGYLVHGAVIAGIDQLAMANVTVFIGYALGISVVVCFTPLTAGVVYAAGLASFVAAIEIMQPLPGTRLMLLPNGFSISVVSAALASLLFTARARDYVQRITIGKQRAELARMNADLERRVREQVSEIVVRAREIEQLNARLRAQVQARSTELSMALAKLSLDRDAGGKLRKGVLLGDRFEIDVLLGEGGMGSVYSGIDHVGGGRVAIKVIQASSAQQLDALRRFLGEARTAAQVAHPAVVRMLHVDVSADGILFQVQELVEGETLYRRLLDKRPWDPARVARLGSVLCDALAAAHAAGVVHRDVKPGNMMLTRTPPGLKLLDFGISKLLREHTRQGSSPTGGIAGTPAYMSPEQLEGGELSDRSDVYAVGVILFRMLSGTFPFDEASTRGALLQPRTAVAPDLRSRCALVPAELARLVASCLVAEPEGRPRAAELSRHLEAFADAAEAPPLERIAQDVASLAPARASTEAATVHEGRGVSDT